MSILVTKLYLHKILTFLLQKVTEKIACTGYNSVVVPLHEQTRQIDW